MPRQVAGPRRDAAAYVVQRGLAAPGTALTVTDLLGGVSGEVVLVSGPDRRVVVKRALAELDVPGVWRAKPERALTEAAALAVFHALTPRHSPQVLDVDVDALTFTMTAAPAGWRDWKTVLLDPQTFDAHGVARTAAGLGTVLGTWHRATWHDADLAARFDDAEAFEQLRLAPFHGATAARHPELRDVLLGCADDLRTRRDCLVHGDFSPKNVLVGDGLWVLDAEVAHVGAAVFDLAFLHCHLALKALHQPDRAPALAAAAAAFTTAYAAVAPDRPAPAGLARHTACLLLARLDGLSPAGYLSPAAAVRVRAVATSGLHAPDQPVEQLWADVLTAAAAIPSQGALA